MPPLILWYDLHAATPSRRASDLHVGGALTRGIAAFATPEHASPQTRDPGSLGLGRPIDARAPALIVEIAARRDESRGAALAAFFLGLALAMLACGTSATLLLAPRLWLACRRSGTCPTSRSLR